MKKKKSRENGKQKRKMDGKRNRHTQLMCTVYIEKRGKEKEGKKKRERKSEERRQMEIRKERKIV